MQLDCLFCCNEGDHPLVYPLTTDDECNCHASLAVYMLSVGTMHFEDRFGGGDRGKWAGIVRKCHTHGGCLGWL